MTKKEIAEHRDELVKVLIEIKELTGRKQALAKILQEDFDAHEIELRSLGLRTPSGLLIRRPSWVLEARPVVEL